MKICEYMKKKNFDTLDTNGKIFMAKLIMKEVKQIAQEKNISEKLAYQYYSEGLYGGDREIGDEAYEF